MMRRLPVILSSLLFGTGVWAAAPVCQFEQVSAGPQKMGAWIDKSNWLSVENQRLTLQAAELFMPARRLAPSGDAQAVASRLKSIDDFPASDPLDGSRRKLGFLLDSRLYADGVVVMRQGRIVAERYRNGLQPDKPRLLLDAGRPWLNLLGAMSVSQGKLAADKAVSRYLPDFPAAGGLRKISVRRLLESEARFDWEEDDLDAWRRDSGWTAEQAGGGVRAWLSQAGRWDKPVQDQAEPPMGAPTPDGDLLAWVLAESNAMPLSQLFCEQLLRHSKPEHPVLWVGDAQGVELASGMGMSLRDFAKLGQLLVEARSGRSRARVPNWFVETLLASSGIRSSKIKGLAKGSEQRYGFVHLGGAPNRVALIGAHGTNLYMDFDKRLVVAIYATRPGNGAPETLALLEQVWQAVDRATASPAKKGRP